MYKIGDFSQLAQVTVRTLRLYDELGLLRPAQIDKFTGYRYYALEQLPRLNRILALKDLGLSLEAIADLLNGKLNDAQFYELLAEKQTEIEREMKASQARLARVAARLAQIEQEGQPPKYEVVLKTAERLWIASVRGIVPKVEMMGEVRYKRLQALYSGLVEAQVSPHEPEIYIYHNPEYTDTDIDMETATAIDRADAKRLTANGTVLARELPAAEQVASVIHRGPLWEVPQAIIALFTWIGANGFTSAGVIREHHLRWRELELTEKTVEAVTLEMQIPVVRLEEVGS
ncbi:MAG: MerR family transcriptional regulator [Anaerolineales bacterium]